MDFKNIALREINWDEVETVTRAGERGSSEWKEVLFNGMRTAVAEISPNYRSADCCSKGHILYCIQGELTIEFNDGRKVKLLPGRSLIHGEGEPHIAITGNPGAKIFVVD